MRYRIARTSSIMCAVAVPRGDALLPDHPMNPATVATAANHRVRLLLPLSLLALYLIWGSTYLAIHFALESWPPFLLEGTRLLAAGLLLFGGLRLRGVALPTPRQWRNAAITGVLLLGIGNGLRSVAEKHVGSGVTAVALASMPLFAALFGIGFGHKPNRLEAWGLACGFAGVAMLNFGSSLSGSHIAALALLLGAASWAFGSVWSKQQDMPSGSMNTAIQMLCAGSAQYLVGFGCGERLPAHPTLRAGAAMIYLVLFGSLIGFSAFVYALKHARPALATSYAYVNPPVAVLLGVLLAGERMSAFEVIGMTIILLGVAVIALAHRQESLSG
ncbi:MAG: drug/metabolite exporter YedA [Rhodanobacter sp.]